MLGKGTKIPWGWELGEENSWEGETKGSQEETGSGVGQPMGQMHQMGQVMNVAKTLGTTDEVDAYHQSGWFC